MQTAKDQIAMYSSLYDLLTKTAFQENYPPMAERAFYNCMALAAKESFGEEKENMRNSLVLIGLAEKFMELAGLNEEPDEMPYVISAVRANAIHAMASICRKNPAGKTEKDIEDDIVNLFGKISQFECYDYVGRQVETKDGDRIDVLAKERETGRDVIIEIKKGATSAHKQLRSYAYGYKDPVLINISEDQPARHRDGVVYLTYSSLVEN